MVATTANTSIWFLMLSRWNARNRRAMVSAQTVTVGRPPGVQQDSLSVTPRKGEPAHSLPSGLIPMMFGAIQKKTFVCVLVVRSGEEYHPAWGRSSSPDSAIHPAVDET